MNASVLFSPQYEAQCSLPKGPKSLPQCGDGLRPGQEDWCTVCGPTLNAEHEIDFYFFDKIQNVCEPRNPRGDTALCAAANTSSGCSAHPFKCVW